ncbi:hypothetical protein ABMA28_013867 [Loxostege sticticalis]|uniref:Reverse transcriptase domain-containing protein n=1 Tax=Loxostege sticticalis TaxID=481309 RepID=A0ABD0TK45_LOXSC
MKRKELKEKMEEEIEKGKVAYIRYDKLIVKEAPNEKRKRSPTQSPKTMPGTSESISTMAFNKQPSKKNKQPNTRKITPSRPVTVGEDDHHPPTNLLIKPNTNKGIQKRSSLYICTLNTRTLRTPESLQELELAIENIKWDILGISEMRRLGERIEERRNFILYHKVTSDMDLNEKYKKIENKLKERAKIQINKSQESYLSEKTKKLIEDRRNLIKKKDKKENQHEISNLSKQIRRKTQLSNKEHKNKQNNAIKELELIPEILVTEVEKSIKSQKMEKSPGPDRITNELMRGTTEELSPILTKVFNEILYTGRIPSQWAESHIILIHKKGPKDDIGNYRPISLISNVYKVFAKVILDRISLTLDENQPVEQAGFRKDFSTIDHIHTVKQLIQKYNEYNKTIYLAFIDYAKAFDSLKHESVWRSLREQGIQNSYVNIIKNIYSESKARIRLESIGETFPIEKGVRQGDPLSPKLFTAVLEQLFRKLDWGHLGLNINGTRLSHLRFADDLVILEEDPLTLESMIQTLVDRSREVGLEMNTSKTKMMTNSIPIDITINGQKLEYVEEYVYLGQIISPKDQMSKEIDKRIASGWKTFWALKEIMKSKELGMKIKKKTFDTCILPCITYGCETRALTKHHRDKLVRCQRSMERSMLGLKLMDKIRSTDIRRKSQMTQSCSPNMYLYSNFSQLNLLRFLCYPRR